MEICGQPRTVRWRSPKGFKPSLFCVYGVVVSKCGLQHLVHKCILGGISGNRCLELWSLSGALGWELYSWCCALVRETEPLSGMLQYKKVDPLTFNHLEIFDRICISLSYGSGVLYTCYSSSSFIHML